MEIQFQELLEQSPILFLIVSCLFAVLTFLLNRNSNKKIEKAVNPQKEIDKNSERAEKVIETDFEKMVKFHKKQVLLIDEAINREVNANVTFKLSLLREYHLQAVEEILQLQQKGGDENGNVNG